MDKEIVLQRFKFLHQFFPSTHPNWRITILSTILLYSIITIVIIMSLSSFCAWFLQFLIIMPNYFLSVFFFFFLSFFHNECAFEEQVYAFTFHNILLLYVHVYVCSFCVSCNSILACSVCIHVEPILLFVHIHIMHVRTSSLMAPGTWRGMYVCTILVLLCNKINL